MKTLLRNEQNIAKPEIINYRVRSILKVLVYFDLFRYPLKPDEIRTFLDQQISEDELKDSLNKLTQLRRIFKLNEFYSLQNDVSLVERRRKGNTEAICLLAKAERIAGLLYKFPYVRAIGISGSLSKNFADEKADIDYFIITKADRLWIARTFLHLFKKIPFIKGPKKFYCMNYFVDEAGLVIEEKNIYTATELVTLIPMAGNGSMKKFFETNAWSFNYFPNQGLPPVKEGIKKPEPWFKKFSEYLLNNKLGNWIDDYLMKLTTRRWQKKEAEHRLNTKGERMGLKTGKHFSKPNPIFFHDRFLSNYANRLAEIEKKL